MLRSLADADHLSVVKQVHEVYADFFAQASTCGGCALACARACAHSRAFGERARTSPTLRARIRAHAHAARTHMRAHAHAADRQHPHSTAAHAQAPDLFSLSLSGSLGLSRPKELYAQADELNLKRCSSGLVALLLSLKIK